MISSHIISWSTQIFRNLPVPWPFFSFFAFWKPSKGPWMPTHSDPAKCECWEKCRWPNPHFHELSEELLASLQTSGVSAVDGEFMDFAVLVVVHCSLTDTFLHSIEAWYIVLWYSIPPHQWRFQTRCSESCVWVPNLWEICAGRSGVESSQPACVNYHLPRVMSNLNPRDLRFLWRYSLGIATSVSSSTLYSVTGLGRYMKQECFLEPA